MSDIHPCNDRGSPLSGSASFRQLYSKLIPNEIRILLLSPGGATDPIEVQLEVVASTKSQQYEALSYVWGAVGARHLIECNHVPFQVTESLYTALLHLRYQTNWRRLWVDQICINQADEAELMAQVTMMGSIYSSSSRVVVWLGERDDSMTKAWEIVEESCLSISLVRSDFLDASPVAAQRRSSSSPVTKSPSRSKIKNLTNSLRGSSRKSLSSTKSESSITRPLRGSFNESNSSLSSSTSSLSSASLTAKQPPRTPIRKRRSDPASRLKTSNSSPRLLTSPNILQPSKLKLALSIFQHAYFTRLWTFQEVVLSPAAIFVSDGIEFALADLMGWYFHYVSKPLFISPGNNKQGISSSPGDTMVYDSVGSFENIMHVRHQISKAEDSSELFSVNTCPSSILKHDMKLSTLLMLTRQLKTLKAEDRVLSLLGLHQGFADYLKRITDTEGWLPVPELFLAAFRYCVEQEHSLDVLSAAGIYAGNKRKGFEGWPSWLPDWREAYPLRPLVLENVKSGAETILNDNVSDQIDNQSRHSSLYQASDVLQKSVHIEEDEYGKFRFEIDGYRLGIVLTKPHSWPGCFFVADSLLQALLATEEDRKPTTHSQQLESILTFSSTKTAMSAYAEKVVADAQTCHRYCEPLRTFAAIEPGDWVCMLSGGAMLYVLRPVRDTSAIEAGSTSFVHVDDVAANRDSIAVEVSDSESRRRATSVPCRFIGECAVATLMHGQLARHLRANSTQPRVMRFELA